MDRVGQCQVSSREQSRLDPLTTDYSIRTNKKAEDSSPAYPPAWPVDVTLRAHTAAPVGLSRWAHSGSANSHRRRQEHDRAPLRCHCVVSYRAKRLLSTHRASLLA